MRNLLMFFPLMYVCHEIVSAFTLFSAKREDKGLPPLNIPDWIIIVVLGIPFLFDAVYQITFGLIDHFRLQRLGEMCAERDDQIAALEAKVAALSDNVRLHEIYEAELFKSCNLSQAAPETFSEFVRWNNLYHQYD